MNWCDDHWTRLREAIEAREGLSDLIAGDGARAAHNAAKEVQAGKVTLATFDPLMGAFWAINGNAVHVLTKQGGSISYLMQPKEVPEDPVDPEQYRDAKGRTWPRCPLCYLGLAHELTCAGCSMPKVDGFAWMIDKAADEQVEVLTRLRAEESEAR